MVRSADDYNIDIFVVDQFSPVFVKIFNFFACDLLGLGGPAVENFVVDVA